MTPLLAPRFLASAFASGPAFLILLCLLAKQITPFDPGREQVQTLAKIATYGTLLTVFFFLCEVFVVFYSRLPGPMAHFQYLFFGIDGKGIWVPWMWCSLFLMGLGIFLLIIPATRRHEGVLSVACGAVFIGTWLDKGLGLISGGFVPSPLNHVTEYIPTGPELLLSLGVWAAGLFILTFLFKMTLSVKEEALTRLEKDAEIRSGEIPTS